MITNPLYDPEKELRITQADRAMLRSKLLAFFKANSHRREIPNQEVMDQDSGFRNQRLLNFLLDDVRKNPS